MSEWISVGDRLPLEPDKKVTYESRLFIVTDGSRVLAADFDRGCHCGKAWAAWNGYGDIRTEKITHWIPLPSPPTEQDK